ETLAQLDRLAQGGAGAGAGQDHDLLAHGGAGDALEAELLADLVHLVAGEVDGLELALGGGAAEGDQRRAQAVGHARRVAEQVAGVGEGGQHGVAGGLVEVEAPGELGERERLARVGGEEVQHAHDAVDRRRRAGHQRLTPVATRGPMAAARAAWPPSSGWMTTTRRYE